MKLLKKTLPILLLLSAVNVLALDVTTSLVSVRAGYLHWNASHNPNAKTGTDNIVDNAQNVKLSEDGDQVVFVELTHALPFVPNVQIENTVLKSNTSDFVGSDLDFLQDFGDTDALNTEFYTNITDLNLFWGVGFVVGKAGFGISARSFTFETEVSSNVETRVQKNDADFVLPALFAQANVNILNTGLFVNAKTYLIDNDNQDLRLALGYKFSFPAADLGIELGYREMSYTVDGNDVDIPGFDFDYNLSGSYLGLRLKF